MTPPDSFPLRTIWTFHAPTQLVFGRDCVGQLGEITGRLNGRRVLIVTDPALVDAGVVDRVCHPLKESRVEVEVFDGGQPEPPIQAVDGAVEAARAAKSDMLLGLGGGSNMDIAKVAATVLAHGGSSTDYAGDQVIPGPIFPLLLMPTTAGTGSEVTAAAVLANPETGSKFGILSNYLRPLAALVDPLLTVSCPAKATANSGIDALSHAVEAYTAVDNEEFPLPEGESTVYQGRHLLGDVLAEQAIGLIGRFLRRAVADGNDLEARDGMALAATVAGLAFSNVGVAAVHALEYAVGNQAHTPHGLGCGLLLPYVMRFNASARPQQMARIADLLGEDLAGLAPPDAATLAADAVDRLKTDIGIPARLRDVGLTEAQLPTMAETALGVHRVLRVNPRRVTQEDLHGILQSAL